MIGINAVLSDLPLQEASIDVSTPVRDVIDSFKNTDLPGVNLLNKGKYIGTLSRSRFHEQMSKQFMFDLFIKKDIGTFYANGKQTEFLVLDESTPLVPAANTVLKRSIQRRNDPIVVRLNNGELRILDVQHLLVIQAQIHSKTLEFLKEANEFKKEVIGIAAHDLRNPIQSIMGFSQILGDLCPNSDEFNKCVGLIYEATKSMNSLVNELLQSAVNDFTDLVIEKSQIEMVSLLESVISFFQLQLNRKNQKLLFARRPDNPVHLEADRKKIVEVFENLISNAIKYSPLNTTTSISLMQTNDSVSVSVSDQGVGLPSDDLKKMFKNFKNSRQNLPDMNLQPD